MSIVPMKMRKSIILMNLSYCDQISFNNYCRSGFDKSNSLSF